MADLSEKKSKKRKQKRPTSAPPTQEAADIVRKTIVGNLEVLAFKMPKLDGPHKIIPAAAGSAEQLTDSRISGKNPLISSMTPAIFSRFDKSSACFSLTQFSVTWSRPKNTHPTWDPLKYLGNTKISSLDASLNSPSLVVFSNGHGRHSMSESEPDDTPGLILNQAEEGEVSYEEEEYYGNY